MNDIDMYENIIVRRKAKRIQRAREQLDYVKQDIESADFIYHREKEHILADIERIQLYLVNDDKEENEYNYEGDYFKYVLTLCNACQKEITVEAPYKDRNKKFLCDECQSANKTEVAMP